MKNKKLGIPYMGTKRKLAPKILDYILENNPNCKYIYDLFGGGGAISFEALQRNQIKQVYYNELNTAIVKLLEKIRDDGITSEFYEWIDRETFHKLKDGDDWKAGLIKTCWSFGNNSEKGYMFGKNIEEIKKEAHFYLMNNGYDYTSETRVKLLKQFKLDKEIQGRFELEQLQQLEQLQRLEQLQQLERLEQLEQLHISSLSYDDVKIETPINETVIYLDPPYENCVTSRDTRHKEYNNALQGNGLENYIRNSKYKIYVSSYDFNLPEVANWGHRSLLSATANNKVVEKLFCNREEPKVKQFELF